MPTAAFRLSAKTTKEAGIHYAFRNGGALPASPGASPAFEEYAATYAVFKAVAPVLRRYVRNRIGLPDLSQDEFNALFWSAMQSASLADWHAFVRQQGAALSLAPAVIEAAPGALHPFARQFSRCGGEYWRRMLYLSRKRRTFIGCFEQCAAVAGLALFLPLFALIGAAIVLLMGRPVFYRQKRVGKEGRQFMLFKFRTMYTVEEYRRRSGNGEWHGITQGNDDRISPLGRFLRRFKIDELPQLINIFLGEMEVIGFRPEISEKVELTEPDYAVLCLQKPGLSDPASLAFIDESASIAALQSAGRADVYDTIILPLKTRLSTAYLMKRAASVSDPAIVLLTLFHSQAGGADDPSKLPAAPDIPAVPERWAARYFPGREI